MSINELVNFKLDEGVSKKENKPYYCIKIVVGQVEKVLCFLTSDQYKLIKSSLK